MLRGDVALIDPRLAPMIGETLEFVETGEVFRLDSVEAQEGQGKTDHYRARIVPVSRG